MQPLEALAADRARARDARDPWAGLCALANVDESGNPQVRTLVLRELEGGLGIFVNATSPKWPVLADRIVAVSVFLGTPNVQYRMRCRTRAVPEEIVRESWALRPLAPRRMDWLYEHHAQSTRIAGRAALLEALAGLTPPEPTDAPASARGLYLDPLQIERLDLAQPDGVHDRRLWRLEEGHWIETTLVP